MRRTKPPRSTSAGNECAHPGSSSTDGTTGSAGAGGGLQVRSPAQRAGPAVGALSVIQLRVGAHRAVALDVALADQDERRYPQHGIGLDRPALAVRPGAYACGNGRSGSR